MNKKYHEQVDRLIIFTRYPIPGKTKTRLIPELGKAGAADLQRRLTEITFKTAHDFSSCYNIGVELRFKGGDKNKVRRWLGSDSVFLRQPQGDLGSRMLFSFEEAFRQGCRSVVLIGSDTPEIATDHLKQAFDTLYDHDLVLGPSKDGGYWLAGMKAPNDIFKGIAWGSKVVLDQTLKSAEAQGLKVGLLDPLNDIDTFDDLRKWDKSPANGNPYISVIIPALNEENSIEAAISTAANQDAEVIVVDGGSDDHTVQKATAAGAMVQTSDPGRAVQQNYGAGLAQGKTLLFLHADTILPGDYVDYVFEALMDPKAVGGAFRFKTDWDSPMMRATEFLTNFRSRYLKLPYGDQGVFVRKSAFENNNGFPLVNIAEDLFFIRELARKGRIKIVPAETVTSARRWKRLGICRVTLINQLIAAGCFIGVSPRLLATLYQRDKVEIRSRKEVNQ